MQPMSTMHPTSNRCAILKQHDICHGISAFLLLVDPYRIVDPVGPLAPRQIIIWAPQMLWTQAACSALVMVCCPLQ